MRCAMAALVAAFLASGPAGPVGAMGEPPNGELVCYFYAARLQQDPSFRPTPDELKALRQPVLDRMAFLQALLAGVEDDLDLADVERAKTEEESAYTAALVQQMQLIVGTLDEAQKELDCWDEVLKWARLRILPEPDPPIVWQPGEPPPALPPDPLDEALDELWEAIARYHGWLVVRRDDAEERAQALLRPPEDGKEAKPQAPETGGPLVEVRTAAGGLLPVNRPDLGETQELETEFGFFVDVGLGLRWQLSPSFSLGAGIGGGWDTSGLEQLENKNQPGSLPLDGALSAWTGMAEARLYLHPEPGWEVFLGGGVGGAYRHLDLRANGNQLFDDGGTALAWKAEAGAAFDLCRCRLFAEGFLRYRGLGGTTVQGPNGSLDLGAQHDLLFGVGLRWAFP